MAVWLSWLVDAARTAAAGTGKNVYVQPGWESRGHGGLRVVEVVVGHHTATPESSPGDYPSLNVVTYGRSDLPGPLAQLGLGRGGHIYVIAAGLAYHAGASAYAGFYDLNDESIGIEAEDSGDGVWTDAQLFMYPRLVGALLYYMRRGADRYASHRTVATPAGRKPDPTGISDEWMRSNTAIPPAEGDMYGTDQDGRDWDTAYRIRDFVQGYGTVQGDAPPSVAGKPLHLTKTIYEGLQILRALAAMTPAVSVADGAPPAPATPPGETFALIKLIEQMAADLAEVKAQLALLSAGNVDYALLADANADEMDRRARDGDPATGSTT